jgi:hypothetical protein
MTGWPARPRAQHGDRVWLESTVIALGMTTIRYGSHARRDPASGIWLASAAIRYRMLAAALVSSAERGRRCLAGPTLRTFHRGLATVAATQRGGQVEAMNLLMAAATLAGCSSATQCPLSAMMLVATYRAPASPRPAATSGSTVA